METEFGKMIRKLRIKNGEVLGDTAELLGCTTVLLSQIENGKRTVPEAWIDVIAAHYNLDDKDSNRLKEAANANRLLKNRRLILALRPCAVCGAVPNIQDCYDMDKHNYIHYEKHLYKLFCSECGVHNSCGDWCDNKYKACIGWNRRQEENEDGGWNPQRNLGELLKPCPFCGGGFQFYKETRTNKYGKFFCLQYFEHDNDDCILTVIRNEVFTIPAGDANANDGYIGEYAEMWNRRIHHEN